jgi:transposase
VAAPRLIRFQKKAARRPLLGGFFSPNVLATQDLVDNQLTPLFGRHIERDG